LQEVTLAATMALVMWPTPDPAQPAHDGPQFDLVRRGYDPGQVDQEVAALRGALDQAQRSAEVAEQHATMTEAELRVAREQLKRKRAQELENSFGYRVERILVTAGREAQELRARAAAELEAHQAAVEQQLAKRHKAIEEQRRRTAEQHAAAMAEIRAQRSEIEEQAKVFREQVTSECDRQLAETADAIRRQRAEADQQFVARRQEVQASVAELRDVRGELLSDLRRVHDHLADFIGRQVPADS
jgi:chromosome segregation ATPase